MSKLKYTVKSIISVSGYDLEELINLTYGSENFEIVADQELGNQVYNTHVSKGAIKSWDTENFTKFKATGRAKYIYILGTLLTDMCNKDLIPEGEYNIDVTW